MLVEEVCDVIRADLSGNNEPCDDTTTQEEFQQLLTPGTVWMVSPVRADGYCGHAVVIADGVWYDSAQMAPLNATIEGWHASLQYDWACWQCTDVRQLFPPWLECARGTWCACGVYLPKAANVRRHEAGKKHRARMAGGRAHLTT